MKHYLALLVLLCLSHYQLTGQEQFRIMFYNVENLYDTENNPNTNDDDLTPAGNLHWTKTRYWKKLNGISKVIMSVGNNHPPALIGICEVENGSVLDDLTKKTDLKKEKYEYIITRSIDSRGSNIALLYQRDQIKILDQNFHRPIISPNNPRTTRDILHVTGKVVNGDTLDIFICHFPSRNEGIKKTRPFRIKCAKLLRDKTDSIFKIRKNASIIIMGDFNDYPNDISLSETLNAKRISNPMQAKQLYNMFYHLAEKNPETGSYKYRGKWKYIDQFIVSGNLLKGASRTMIKNKKAEVYSAEFLLTDDNQKYGGKKPFRTYSGYRYLGGYSDHLPIYMDLLIKQK